MLDPGKVFSIVEVMGDSLQEKLATANDFPAFVDGVLQVGLSIMLV